MPLLAKSLARPGPARNTRGRDYGAAAVGLGALAGLCGAAWLLGRRRPDPVRKIRRSAVLMGVSILADSAMEHLRGGYHNRAMYVAPALAAATMADASRSSRPAPPLEAASIATGAAGLGFHAWNILKRPGGISWNNLFYAAPVGAPGGLAVAGILALAKRARTAGHGRLLGGFVALATLAEVTEVALLHYRGAWHNPAMVLPVAIPPATAAMLLRQAWRPDAAGRARTRAALQLTGALGVVGTGFHVYGVGRNMGGWGNWRQTALAGPPVPAPASFTALALAGDAALDLMESAR